MTSDNNTLTRRHALATIGAAAGSLLSSRGITSAVSQSSIDIARGTVFEDRSGLGIKTSAARGISGVMVSNGRDVVRTDDDGRWSLPVRNGDSLFVITPSGWTSSPFGARAFSYLHQPLGTPARLELRSPGIEPTGNLPPSIDCPLVRHDQPRQFEALLVADTQAANARELGYVREVILRATRGSDAAFALHHGDVMGDDLSLFPAYLEILRETGLSWHHCPGNHDLNLDAVDPAYAFEAWKRFIGPTNYAFQHAGATFILLNNIDYFGRGAPSANGRGYRGRLGAEQIYFTANVLRNVPMDDLIVLSMHIPLVSFDRPDSISDTTLDRGQLLRLLSGRPYAASFAGHSHTTEHHYLGRRDGFERGEPHHHHVLTAACGSWWSGPLDMAGIPVADSRDGTPKGFHVLSVDGNRYATRFVAFDSAPDPDMRVLIRDNAGQAGSGIKSANRSIVVDVFDGGPKTEVSCELEGQLAVLIKLQRESVADPYVVEAFARYGGLCKPWVAACPSSHVWTAHLPEGFTNHECALTVRVITENGHLLERRVRSA